MLQWVLKIIKGAAATGWKWRKIQWGWLSLHFLKFQYRIHRMVCTIQWLICYGLASLQHRKSRDEYFQTFQLQFFRTRASEAELQCRRTLFSVKYSSAMSSNPYYSFAFYLGLSCSNWDIVSLLKATGLRSYLLNVLVKGEQLCPTSSNSLLGLIKTSALRNVWKESSFLHIVCKKWCSFLQRLKSHAHSIFTYYSISIPTFS